MYQAIRVEHSDGMGMFMSDNGRKHSVIYIAPELGLRHKDFRTPWAENFDFISGEHFCAYKSFIQFEKWVHPDEVKILKDNGYRVYLLNLRHCLRGIDQVVYLKDDILRKEDITNLLLT